MPRDNRCVYMGHVCFYVCCSDCGGEWEACCVAAVVKDAGVLSLGLLNYVVFSVCIVAWSWTSVSVSLCRCIFVSCVHPVAVLNAAFYMTSSLLMLVEDGRGILQSRSHDCLVSSHECLLLFTPICCSECSYDL